MKKLIALLCLLVVVGIMVVSCPDKEAHKNAMKDVVTSLVNEESGLAGDADDGGLAVVGKMIGSSIVGFATEQVLDNSFTVHNYLVFSLGEITFGDQHRTVSVGILNHVFTPSKEDLKAGIKSGIGNKLNDIL